MSGRESALRSGDVNGEVLEMAWVAPWALQELTRQRRAGDPSWPESGPKAGRNSAEQNRAEYIQISKKRKTLLKFPFPHFTLTNPSLLLPPNPPIPICSLILCIFLNQTREVLHFKASLACQVVFPSPLSSTCSQNNFRMKLINNVHVKSHPLREAWRGGLCPCH